MQDPIVWRGHARYALAALGVASIIAVGAVAARAEDSTEGAREQADEMEASSSPPGRDVSRSARATATTAPPVFVPRSRGAPAGRVGGATRQGALDLIVSALVPEFDDAALCQSEQPVLYWHLSKGTSFPVNFTLSDLEAMDPMVDVTLKGPFAAGIHAIDLADHGVRLPVGRSYEWFVAVVPNPTDRSADAVARGAIRRVEGGAAEAHGANDAAARVRRLAGAGLWYDALDAASESGEQAVLVEQVGLELSRR